MGLKINPLKFNRVKIKLSPLKISRVKFKIKRVHQVNPLQICTSLLSLLFTGYLAAIFMVYAGFLAISALKLYTIGCAGVGLFYALKRRQINFSLLLLVFSVLIFGLINNLLVGNVVIGDMFLQMCFIAIAFALCNINISPLQSAVLLYSAVAYYLTFIISGQSLEDAIYIVSKNYISVYLLAFLTYYYIAHRQKELKVHPVLVVFAVTLFGMGRGGILSIGSLAFLLLLLIITNNADIKTWHRWLTGILMVGIIFALVNVFYSTELFSKFIEMRFETPRFQFWQQYWEDAVSSLVGILLGAKINLNEYLQIEKTFDGNLHNSFMQLHANYGLVILVSLLALIMRTMTRYIKEKNYLFAILLLVLCVRASSDMVFGTGYTTFNSIFLYYLLLYPICTNKLPKISQR